MLFSSYFYFNDHKYAPNSNQKFLYYFYTAKVIRNCPQNKWVLRRKLLTPMKASLIANQLE